jgi:TPR repeat protein
VAESSQKAFEYYDRAAEFEPYALLKLGQFMEQGKYEEGYKGVKHLQYAYGFYYRATQLQDGCREALFKLGDYQHHGKAGDVNLGQAIRKYQESAAEGNAEAMNALGSLFYNEMRDFKQAAEWFKKAADRGFTRALNNLG